MAGQEFLNSLENNASQALQGHSALKQAIKLHKVMDLYLSPGNVDQVIRMAERIRISSLQENVEIFNMEDNVEISAQDLVSSDFLVGKITAWIEKTREELFGAPEPPFIEDLESAISWIETTARDQCPVFKAGYFYSCQRWGQIYICSTGHSFIQPEQKC